MMTTAWMLEHATADQRTAPTTTTVTFCHHLHLQTRSHGSATTMSTPMPSKCQKGPNASSAAMLGLTALRNRPQLYQSVCKEPGKPLKLYPTALTNRISQPYQVFFPNQMTRTRLSADCPLRHDLGELCDR